MGTRFKTFDATGIAPSGRLFAGDLNGIQDIYADLTNFTQVVSVGTLRIGEAPLMLVRHAAGEARVTGHLRTDEILRGLGGLFAGTFTTTERDAMVDAERPYGIIILNTTTNRLEINLGTASVPVWRAVGLDGNGNLTVTGLSVTTITQQGVPAKAIPAGAIVPYGGAAAPAGFLLCDGVAHSRATYANLFAAIGVLYGAGDGVNTFNVPNMKGRVPVGRDVAQLEFDSLGQVGGEKTHLLTTAEMPSHTHIQNAHEHTVRDVNSNTRLRQGAPNVAQSGTGRRAFIGGDEQFIDAFPTTAINQNAGGGAQHNNIQPYNVFNYIIAH